MDGEPLDAAAGFNHAEHLANLLSLSYEPMLAWRLDGAIEFWNAGAKRLYGFLPEEALGKVSHSLLQTEFPSEFAQVHSQLSNEGCWSGVLRHTCKNGHQVIVDSRMQMFGTDMVLEVNRDVTNLTKAAETQQLLIAELSHRVKNTLATVQAIMHQTLRRAENFAAFETGFTGRIQSLSRVHTQLTDSGWQGADLQALIRDQLLAGAVDGAQVTALGPPIRLLPQMALHLGLMLHELGTNAIKYGALSSPDGLVIIRWAMEDAMLHVRWAERGGPTPKAPMTRGFGRTLIESGAKSEGGAAHISVEGEGIVWNIALPLPEPAIEAAKMLPVASIREKPSPSSLPIPSKLAGLRFLVIEDEPLVAMDIVAALEHAGIEVVGCAATTDEALTLIENTSIDGALLDANLHDRPVDQIAAVLAQRNIPFFFVTGYGRKHLPHAFANRIIIAKPFSWEELASASAALFVKPGRAAAERTAG